MTQPEQQKSTQTKATTQNSQEQTDAAKQTSSSTDGLNLSEGEYRALRDDAGVNQSAGLDDNTVVWEQSEAGKTFLAGEADRQKAIQEEEKVLTSATNSDNLDEGSVKYVEAVNK